MARYFTLTIPENNWGGPFLSEPLERRPLVRLTMNRRVNRRTGGPTGSTRRRSSFRRKREEDIGTYDNA
jgi:hypothetical protein